MWFKKEEIKVPVFVRKEVQYPMYTSQIRIILRNGEHRLANVKIPPAVDEIFNSTPAPFYFPFALGVNLPDPSNYCAFSLEQKSLDYIDEAGATRRIHSADVQEVIISFPVPTQEMVSFYYLAEEV